MASRADGGISGTKSNSLCRPLVVVRDKGMDRDVQLAAPFEKAQFDNKRRGDDIRADAAYRTRAGAELVRRTLGELLSEPHEAAV